MRLRTERRSSDLAMGEFLAMWAPRGKPRLLFYPLFLPLRCRMAGIWLPVGGYPAQRGSERWRVPRKALCLKGRQPRRFLVQISNAKAN